LAEEQVMVVGLGRFGRALGEALVGLGQDVLGVDSEERLVQECAELLTHVVQADATDREALRQIGAADFRSAVVAIGNDIEASILATHTLIDLGVRQVWAKAITASHGAILERVGAHRVVFPERDMGVRVAHSMVGRTIDYLEIDQDFVLIETTVPRALVGRSLADGQIRTRHGVTVVCVKERGGRFTYATADTVLGHDDLLVIAGTRRAAERFSALA
jgi:trk system potassium uptake protein